MSLDDFHATDGGVLECSRAANPPGGLESYLGSSIGCVPLLAVLSRSL
ncbi:hypothetical protein [Calidithermus timidus]|nr:hypothetical protein [Calidithermus timidus]